MDVLIIAIAALVLVAVVGQSAVVYLTDKAARAESLTVTLTLRSMEKTDAEALVKKLTEENGEAEVRYGLKAIGSIKGSVTVTPLDASGAGGSYHLCDVVAVFTAKGSVRTGGFSLYGVGEVKTGDLVPLYVDGVLTTAAIREIAVAEANT